MICLVENYIKTVLQLAIKSEKNAQKLYQHAYKTTKIKSLKILFKRLFNEEKKHKVKIENIDVKKLVFKKTRINHRQIAKSLMMTPLNELNDLRKTLDFAIKKEQEAFTMYQKLSTRIETTKVKKLLTELAKQEALHKSMLIKTKKLCL